MPLPAPWEGDQAHSAVSEWIRCWRTAAGADASLPQLGFGRHLGSEATALMGRGMSLAGLVGLFAAAGYRGECPCGASPSGQAWTDGASAPLMIAESPEQLPLS